MTNHLADELRGILDDLHDAEHGDVPKALVRERLERLVEHVERLATKPVEVDASTELTASFGLEPEQEIRTQAARSLAWRYPSARNPEDYTEFWDQLDALADWIRTGQRP